MTALKLRVHNFSYPNQVQTPKTHFHSQYHVYQTRVLIYCLFFNWRNIFSTLNRYVVKTTLTLYSPTLLLWFSVGKQKLLCEVYNAQIWQSWLYPLHQGSRDTRSPIPMVAKKASKEMFLWKRRPKTRIRLILQNDPASSDGHKKLILYD